MKREQLKVEKREVLGKQVKKLRREGILPGNVYGKDLKSIAVQLPMKSFKDVFKEVHETGLVDLALEDKVLPVLIHNVQVHPKTHEPLHADFFKVNLKEKISANIPVVPVGEPVAVLDKKGVLLHLLGELEVEALPTDLPERIEVNVEKLAGVGDQIEAGQIKMPESVILLTEPSEIVFKIDELVSKEAEEQAAAEEAAAAEAATAEGEAEAAEAQPEKEKPEEKQEQPQKQKEEPANQG